MGVGTVGAIPTIVFFIEPGGEDFEAPPVRGSGCIPAGKRAPQTGQRAVSGKAGDPHRGQEIMTGRLLLGFAKRHLIPYRDNARNRSRNARRC